jgi:hypothetical protein
VDAPDDAVRAGARWRGLWGSMADAERREAALRYLTAAEEQPAARASALVVIAVECRTSPSAVEGWPIETRADRLARAPRLDPPFIAALVARFLVGVHGGMVRRFLDLAGVEHVGGEIVPAAARGEPCAPERLRTAVRTIAAQHAARDVALFLDALDVQRIPRLAGLASARRDVDGAAQSEGGA